METTEKNVHSCFWALLKLMPCAEKEEIVNSYSGGITTSLSEFYERYPLEYQIMLADMEQKTTITRLKNEALIKQKRSAVLKRLQKYGIDTTDWNKVNDFLMQPKIAGKKLYDMSIDELQKLIAKLEIILKKENRKS